MVEWSGVEWNRLGVVEESKSGSVEWNRLGVVEESKVEVEWMDSGVEQNETDYE